ncbi:helix-turn-helix domain-containing protein [Rhodococcus sp. CX]|uniref:helix-turn-helix domain-containing protein n=1 Tax=Rhodococcus sp. CX TaxID=2789880 RepID=UPI0018CEE3CF|nr:helix-turn-helix domain-containing protein [Rhodococcus sp. CX]MBH0119836.1 helix-turn-helix domain-containing protein [Rhodococcus sp. CX]
MAAWTDEESRRLRELHEQGMSLRAIAEEMGRPQSTVSRWADRLNLSFDRSKTKKATEARVIDLKARKAVAAENALEILELSQAAILATLRGKKGWSTLIRGSEGREVEAQLDFIPSRDLREQTNAHTGQAAVLDKLTDTTTEHDNAKSMLGQLEAALIAAVHDEEEAGASGDPGQAVDLPEAGPLDCDSER